MTADQEKFRQLIGCFATALSVIGLPPFGGAWSKWFIGLGAMETGQLIFIVALMVSSLLNVAYLLPVVMRGFFPGGPTEFDGGVKEAPLACLIPLSFTAVMCVILFFFPDPAYDLLSQLVE